MTAGADHSIKTWYVPTVPFPCTPPDRSLHTGTRQTLPYQLARSVNRSRSGLSPSTSTRRPLELPSWSPAHSTRSSAGGGSMASNRGGRSWDLVRFRPFFSFSRILVDPLLFQPSPGTSLSTLAQRFSLPPARRAAFVFSQLRKKSLARSSQCSMRLDRSAWRLNMCVAFAPPARSLADPLPGVQSISGSLLAVASETGYVSLFDAETGALISSFPGSLIPPLLTQRSALT